MTAAGWTNFDFEKVVQLFGARTGISFPASRYGDAELGIRRAMTNAGLRTLSEYYALVSQDEAAFEDLVIQLTVGETYFFRHPQQWEVIRRLVLPDIRARKGRSETIRAWSAGCASGEEPYTLAILAEQEGLADRLHVLGTDISRRALERCRTATYSRWSARGCEEMVRQYLETKGERYVVPQRIRQRVSFEHLNLALDIYPSLSSGTADMDLIMCRNVMIYFDQETTRAVARRLFESLAPGGWLIPGAADPPISGEAPFEVVMTEAGLAYRRGARAAASHAAQHRASQAFKVNVHSEDVAVADVFQPTNVPAKHLAAAEALSTRSGNLQLETSSIAQTDIGSSSPGNGRRRLESLRVLASADPEAAEKACAEAIDEFSLSAELHYLHAILLIELERSTEALQAVRRCLYLDHSLAIAHFTLGSILQRQGDLQGARRAYRNARDLCRERPPEELVALADQESAGRLAEAAEVQLQHLDAVRAILEN